ncbi:MAG: hypothetical protein U1C46_04215 [Bacteroidales bacterium]|nr:hypothetical protein [Bacteroidales bacterium]MDZ4204008.1 hypothetical protein [Bacteroidales bacterium]
MKTNSKKILQQIQDEIDRRGGQLNSEEELNQIAAQIMQRQNSTPLSDYEGLSPYQMHMLLYQPFEPGSVVKYRSVINDEKVLSSPMLIACFKIVEAIHPQKGLKLTQTGRLPRKIVHDIYSMKLCPSRFESFFQPKILNESDYPLAATAHALLKLSGIIKHKTGKIFVTRVGKKAIGNNPYMFELLFTAFVSKFNKGYLDFYGETDIGNIGVLFVLYLLHKYGRELRDTNFYATKYFRAFPTLYGAIDYPFSHNEDNSSSNNCFTLRVLNHGLVWFGLVEQVTIVISLMQRTYQVKNALLFNEVFEIK